MQSECRALWNAQQALETDRVAALEALLTLAIWGKSVAVRDAAAVVLSDIGVQVLGESNANG